MRARSLKSLVAAAAAVAVAGCVTQGDLLADQGTLLAAAGFIARPANTPERQASLRTLPPGRVVQEAHGEEFSYVVADPIVCNCLYTGDTAAYGRYQQELFQRNIVDQQVTAAQLSQLGWDWGPWGGPYWGSGIFIGGYYGGHGGYYGGHGGYHGRH